LSENYVPLVLSICNCITATLAVYRIEYYPQRLTYSLIEISGMADKAPVEVNRWLRTQNLFQKQNNENRMRTHKVTN